MSNKSTKSENFENYISQVEAARIAGITKQAIGHLIRRGYFTTREIAGRVLILRSELESLKERHKGRPRKGVSKKSKASIQSSVEMYKEDSEKYISRAEAARIRGVSQPAITDLIRRGRLTPIMVADRTLLLRSEVEAFIPQPRIGRPPKKAASKSFKQGKSKRK